MIALILVLAQCAYHENEIEFRKWQATNAPVRTGGKVRFEVTTEDIALRGRLGINGNPYERRKYPNSSGAPALTVDASNRWTDGGLFRVMVPDSAKRFALTFDSGGRVIEFSFTIAAENFVEYQRV